MAYREDGKWSLHAGDAYFDTRINFLQPPPGLPLEIAFQADAADRQASLRRLRDERGTEVSMFCPHDQHGFQSWTAGRNNPDILTQFD